MSIARQIKRREKKGLIKGGCNLTPESLSKQARRYAFMRARKLTINRKAP